MSNQENKIVKDKETEVITKTPEEVIAEMEKKAEAAEASKGEKLSFKPYPAGNYVAVKGVFTVVREFTYKNKTNKDGSIARTFGTWAVKPDNFIKFDTKSPTVLTDEDLKNETIHKLIENGSLRRTL